MLKTPSFANYLADAAINVSHYMSDSSGKIDQSEEWGQAVNHANLTGTNLYISGGTTIYLSKVVNVPTQSTIIGDSDLAKSVYPDHSPRESTILLSSSAYIRMDEDSTLRGVRIIGNNAYREGGGHSDPSSLFDGTGVFIDGSDCTIDKCTIAGFYRGIDSGSINGTGRTFISNINMDNINGIRLYNSLDTSRLENIQMWPFFGSSSKEKQLRSGVGFDIITSDWTRLNNCFTWGYSRGFRFQDSTFNLMVLNCGSDIDAGISIDAQHARGIEFIDQYGRNITISGFQSAQMEYGIVTFLGDGIGQKSTISIIGGSFILNKYNIDFQGSGGSGLIASVTGVLIQPRDNVTSHPLGQSFGIRAVNDDTSLIATNNVFHNMSEGMCISVSSTPTTDASRVLGTNIYVNVINTGDGI